MISVNTNTGVRNDNQQGNFTFRRGKEEKIAIWYLPLILDIPEKAAISPINQPAPAKQRKEEAQQ